MGMIELAVIWRGQLLTASSIRLSGNRSDADIIQWPSRGYRGLSPHIRRITIMVADFLTVAKRGVASQ
jgi:hypothetical protein